MKSNKKLYLSIFLPLYSIIGITSLVFLCLQRYGVAIFFAFPLLFLFPIFLTFVKIPKEMDKHIFLLVLSFLLRYLFVACAIVIPTLLWNYLPSLKETTNSFFVLVPFLEVFFVYNIVIVLYVLDSKKEIQRMNEK